MRTRTVRTALSFLALLGMVLLASGSILVAGLLVAATGAWTIGVVRAELDTM